MGRETILFKSKEVMSRAAAAAFLRHLADKITAGKITLQQGEMELPLDLPAEILLEVTAEDEQKKRGIEHGLEIELKWYDDGPGQPGGITLK